MDSDGGSSGYNSGKGLISPDEQPRSHRDKIAAMSKQAFQTTDFRTIAGQSPKVWNVKVFTIWNNQLLIK